MKATVIANGVYQDDRGRFWIRPVIAGKRTWRKLHAVKYKFAREEAADLLGAHRRSLSGECRSPLTPGTNFGGVAKLYLQANCPNSRGDARNKEFVEREAQRLEFILGFYAGWSIEDIKRPSLYEYLAWRVKQVAKGRTGLRTTEMDWCTLSNVINFALDCGIVDFNFIGRRPRLRENNPGPSSTAVRIAHCREFAPADGNELNLLAQYFFAERVSQPIGFQMLFEAFTGCRTNEALRLRTDARNTDQPGFIQGNHLFLARSKRGINPHVLINSELADFIECWRAWHTANHAGNPWWFPGRALTRQPLVMAPLVKGALNFALRRACAALNLPKRTSHGLRSYFVTRCRGDGDTEAQIAAKLGITSLALLEQVYGGRPPNWDGQRKIRNWPDNAAPAWHRWKPGATRELDFVGEGQKIVELKLDQKAGLLAAPDKIG
jgi:integrase